MPKQNKETEMDRICSLAGGLGDTVKQLNSLSRLMANVSQHPEGAPKIGAEDIAISMRLFTLHLEAIGDGLDTIQDLSETSESSPLKAAE